MRSIIHTDSGVAMIQSLTRAQGDDPRRQAGRRLSETSTPGRERLGATRRGGALMATQSS